jgi:hypothetical protein
MSDSTDWRSAIEVIIPHPSAPRVLLLAEGEGWSLPWVSIDELWAVDVGQICHELRRTLGIATTVLRLASKRSDDEQRQVVMTYVLENRAPSWQPPSRATLGTTRPSHWRGCWLEGAVEPRTAACGSSARNMQRSRACNPSLAADLSIVWFSARPQSGKHPIPVATLVRLGGCRRSKR